jgi:hypothetical protein
VESIMVPLPCRIIYELMHELRRINDLGCI